MYPLCSPTAVHIRVIDKNCKFNSKIIYTNNEFWNEVSIYKKIITIYIYKFMRSDVNSMNNTWRNRGQFTDSNLLLETRSFIDNTVLVKSNLVTPLNSERSRNNYN